MTRSTMTKKKRKYYSEKQFLKKTVSVLGSATRGICKGYPVADRKQERLEKKKEKPDQTGEMGEN